MIAGDHVVLADYCHYDRGNPSSGPPPPQETATLELLALFDLVAFQP